jgi:hypothetical protein
LVCIEVIPDTTLKILKGYRVSKNVIGVTRLDECGRMFLVQNGIDQRMRVRFRSVLMRRKYMKLKDIGDGR